MRDYSVGDKFVLEIKEIDDLKNHMVLEGIAVGVDMLDQLEVLDGDYVNENFGELQDEAYNKGLEDGRNEAWELARKVALDVSDGGYRASELSDIFDALNLQDTFKRYNIQEALSKLAAYEKKIDIGDIVIDSFGQNQLVVGFDSLDGSDEFVNVLSKDGNVMGLLREKVTKTDKHIDISNILQQIGGGTDE